MIILCALWCDWHTIAETFPHEEEGGTGLRPAGLVPAIHVFMVARLNRGCPDQVRA
jgi:hypothetical protein